MKLISSKAILVALLATLGLSTPTFAVSERVVAIVDGNMIMESQITRALGKKAKTPENRKAALEKIIDDMLTQKAIQQSNVKINYKEVDEAIERIAASNGLTYGQLLDALDYQGITLEQYTQQIAQQMRMEIVRQQSIGKSVQIDPEQVREKGREMLEQDKAAGKVKKATALEHRVSHILVKTNPILNDEQAKAKLSRLTQDIKAGKISFEQAAQQNSEDYISGADGGDLGFNFLEAYDPAFAKAARNAKKGQISAPFKSEFGWHILKVTETRQGDITENAYIQKAYEKIVNEQLKEAEKDWVKALRKTAEIQYINAK